MITFVTTTSYGSWLPGDRRGWAQDGQLKQPSAPLEQHAQTMMEGQAVVFSEDDRIRLFQSIINAAKEFQYDLRDLAIEPTHLHWIISHDDSVETMIGRLKNRMRQALAKGRIWTAGYCANALHDESALAQARAYIANHHGCLLSAGIRRHPPASPEDQR